VPHENRHLEHQLDQIAHRSRSKMVRANQPDVLCLQETKSVDEKFPYVKLRTIGYPHIEHLGERAYNGVAIISKLPLTNVQRNLPDEKAPAQSRMLSATSAISAS
jgi:exodeoxyribonuclease-3